MIAVVLWLTNETGGSSLGIASAMGSSLIALFIGILFAVYFLISLFIVVKAFFRSSH